MMMMMHWGWCRLCVGSFYEVMAAAAARHISKNNSKKEDKEQVVMVQLCRFWFHRVVRWRQHQYPTCNIGDSTNFWVSSSWQYFEPNHDVNIENAYG